MKVHFSIRGDWDGHERAGSPVHADFVSHVTMRKTIESIQYGNDETNITFDLGDQSQLRIFSSHRGAEVVYFPPGSTTHYD